MQQGALDEIASFVSIPIEQVEVLASWAVRDDGRGPARDKQAPECIAVVGAVCGKHCGCGQSANQVGCDGSIAALAGRDDEGDDAAEPVDQRMQLGGRPAA